MYNEESISEIYNSDVKESFFYFFSHSLGQMVSVSVISIVIGYLIECFFFDEKKLKRIFLKNKKNNEIRNHIYILIKNISKKYKIFIFISYIITIISWYYIFCFNNVYPNTSDNWIKSTIFIIVLVQLISFIYILLETILRAISFKWESEAIFKLSKILSG